MADDESGRAERIGDEIRPSTPFRSRSQEAYLALLLAADDSRRHASAALEPAGVTLQQYNVLRILGRAGEEGLPTLSLAGRMLERTPGVTRLIDRMEKKGWVTRHRCEQDRRRVWCRITEVGLGLLASLDEAIEEVDDAISAVLDDAEIAQFIDCLERLRAHFGRSS